MMRIKKNDSVKVISGNNKGKTGRVIKVMSCKTKAIIEGLNTVKKHARPTQDNPQGGIVEKELPIHISNLLLLHKGKPAKVGIKILKDGKKIRMNKINGDSID
tara:strand:- start:205 stop:513 length:309 start_codon:yes stop_codon:yes gene_type:complete